MKAEQRHELHQNSLIRFFSRMKAKFKQPPSRKAIVIWGTILLAVIVFLVWKIVGNISESRSSRRSIAVLDMQPAEGEKGEFPDPETLWTRAREEFIQDNKGTIQAYWVELQQARADYRDALPRIFDKGTQSEAKKKLGSAAESFEKLAKEFKSSPILVAECLLGAGRCQETLGDLDRAKDLYQQVSGHKDLKNSEAAKQAERSVERIDRRRDELNKLAEAIEKTPDPTPPVLPKIDDKPSDGDKKTPDPTPPKKDDKPSDADKKTPPVPPKKDDKPPDGDKKN